MATPDPYEILGIKPGASEAEIKSAYRQLSMQHHPDKGGEASKFDQATWAFKYLTSGPEKAGKFPEWGSGLGSNDQPNNGSNGNGSDSGAGDHPSGFKVGDVVNVRRSPGAGGGIQQGWKVVGFDDGKVIVENPAGDGDKPVNAQELRDVQMDPNKEVIIRNDKTGKLEAGWKVVGTGESGVVTVASEKDGVLQGIRHIPLTDLVNTQPTYGTGTSIINSHGETVDGWKVISVDNGKVNVMRPNPTGEGSEIRHIPVDEYVDMQNYISRTGAGGQDPFTQAAQNLSMSYSAPDSRSNIKSDPINKPTSNIKSDPIWEKPSNTKSDPIWDKPSNIKSDPINKPTSNIKSDPIWKITGADGHTKYNIGDLATPMDPHGNVISYSPNELPGSSKSSNLKFVDPLKAHAAGKGTGISTDLDLDTDLQSSFANIVGTNTGLRTTQGIHKREALEDTSTPEPDLNSFHDMTSAKTDAMLANEEMTGASEQAGGIEEEKSLSEVKSPGYMGETDPNKTYAFTDKQGNDNTLTFRPNGVVVQTKEDGTSFTVWNPANNGGAHWPGFANRGIQDPYPAGSLAGNSSMPPPNYAANAGQVAAQTTNYNEQPMVSEDVGEKTLGFSGSDIVPTDPNTGFAYGDADPYAPASQEAPQPVAAEPTPPLYESNPGDYNPGDQVTLPTPTASDSPPAGFAGLNQADYLNHHNI